MSLPQDLLALADRLAGLERRRPKQASLRRSVSTAYYSLFHLLTSGSITLIAPYVAATSSVRLQRWFDHGEMRRVCVLFSTSATPTSIHRILQAAPSADLQQVALAFVQLQAARHEADYDLGTRWTRSTALDFVQTAKDAFEAWARIRRSHEANVFALALLSAKLFEKER